MATCQDRERPSPPITSARYRSAFTSGYGPRKSFAVGKVLIVIASEQSCYLGRGSARANDTMPIGSSNADSGQLEKCGWP